MQYWKTRTIATIVFLDDSCCTLSIYNIHVLSYNCGNGRDNRTIFFTFFWTLSFDWFWILNDLILCICQEKYEGKMSLNTTLFFEIRCLLITPTDRACTWTIVLHIVALFVPVFCVYLKGRSWTSCPLRFHLTWLW